MIRIKRNYRQMEREFTRLKNMPDPKAVAALDKVLGAQFTAMQAATHEETGALKRSQKKSSRTNQRLGTWHGELSAGGGPVDYAIYEAARGVGGAGGPSDAKGDHNFMQPVTALDIAYVAVLLKGIKG